MLRSRERRASQCRCAASFLLRGPLPLLQAARSPGLPFRITGPVDHAAVLHADGRGRVTIASRESGRWHERSCQLGDLGYVVGQFAGREDVYLSQNRFWGGRRLVCSWPSSMPCSSISTSTSSGLSPRPSTSLSSLSRPSIARGAPPSFAVSTGRGLALVWLHAPVPRQRYRDDEPVSSPCTIPYAIWVRIGWPPMQPACCAWPAPATATMELGFRRSRR